MHGVDLDRRNFLRGRLTPSAPAVRPPWSREASLDTCTTCGACIAACPQHILITDPDGLPAVDFAAGECTFCGLCAEACAETVFDRTLPAFPHTIRIEASCLTAGGVVCRTCGDACPEEAIRFQLRLGAPAFPVLDTGRCSGCGACVGQCPTGAISVRPLEAPNA